MKSNKTGKGNTIPEYCYPHRKTYQAKSFRLLSFLLLISLLTFSTTLEAQRINQPGQKEIRGAAAERLVPGARYVLEGDHTTLPAYVKFSPGKEVPVSLFAYWMKETFNLTSAHDFVLVRTETDELGFVHYRYKQTYNGIDLDRGEYVVHAKEGKIVSFGGTAYPVKTFDTSPQLEEQAALESALNYVGAESYMWEVPYWENEIKEHEKDPNATYYPKGKLTITRYAADAKPADNDFRLGYSFDIYPADGRIAERVFVNANTGDILYTLPLESNCEPAVSFTSIFNGSQDIQTEKYTATEYRLRDDCHATSVWVRDWNSLTDTIGTPPLEIDNTDNVWSSMNERFGATVLWEGKESYWYFKNIHGRDSYDDADGEVKAYINAVFRNSNGTYTTNNASMSFNGSRMKVGLSSLGTLANSYATLDIIGHEFTHAVTGFSSNLVYQGEPGALNESFSDIFGEMVENRTNGPNDWLMGDERTNGAIRDLSWPKNNGDPDTYGMTNWANTCGTCSDNGGVHTNSGVQNYWFYLVAVGGSGTNDLGNSYSVTGIGRSKARAIAYRNQTLKLGVNSNYAAARAGAIEAAEDLYGACSFEVEQVTNAWYAVGIGNAFVDLSAFVTNVSCNGEDDGAINLSVNGDGPFTYDWSSGQNTQDISNLGPGNYTVTVTDGNGCSNTLSRTITEPTPLVATASVATDYNGADISCAGANDGAVTVNGSGGTLPYSYDWSTGDDTKNSISLGPGNYTVTITDANGCTATDGATLTEPDPVTADVAATSDYNGYNISCNGGSDGSAEVTPGGGTLPYSYEWNVTADKSAAVSGLSAGFTSVTVSDINGCTAVDTVTLTEPDPLVIDAGSNFTVYYGYPDSACATLSSAGASGGVPPYSYLWSNGENTLSINECPDTTTVYYLTVTDLNGCTATDSVMICVIDVRCGQILNRIEICQTGGFHGKNAVINPITLCVGFNAVAQHLALHNGQLAACGTDKSCDFGAAKRGVAISSELKEVGYNMEAFPNPFSNSTQIRFRVNETERVVLNVYDITGHRVAELYNGVALGGERYEVELDGKLLTNGLYISRLTIGGKMTDTQKLVLAR